MPTPADCVARMLEEDIYPNATHAAPAGSLRESARSAETVGTALGMKATTIAPLWIECGGSEGGKGTANVQKIFLLLKSTKIIGPLMG
eukprot:COSAG05_NODE_7965_length_751_cov_1.237730_1_plen_87_part_10